MPSAMFPPPQNTIFLFMIVPPINPAFPLQTLHRSWFQQPDTRYPPPSDRLARRRLSAGPFDHGLSEMVDIGNLMLDQSRVRRQDDVLARMIFLCWISEPDLDAVVPREGELRLDMLAGTCIFGLADDDNRVFRHLLSQGESGGKSRIARRTSFDGLPGWPGLPSCT